MIHSTCFRKSNVPNPSVLKSMFELRHEIFYQHLGWDVNTHDGQEIDSYDLQQDPVYVVSHGTGGDVCGCFRLLPTTGPYMLGEIFPELLRGEPLPQSPDVWEISRLATSLGSIAPRMDPQLSLCALTLDMFRKGFRYGEEHGVREYVFVTSVAVERMLLRTGLKLRRFGDGKALKIGKVLSVACWLEDLPENRRILSPNANYMEKAA